MPRRNRSNDRAAPSLPRWTSNMSGQYANWPHDGEDAVTIERRFPDTLCAELVWRGQPVKTGDLQGQRSVEIVRRDPATGVLPRLRTRATAAGHWPGELG